MTPEWRANGVMAGGWTGDAELDGALRQAITVAIREAESAVWQRCLAALCPMCAQGFPGVFRYGRWQHNTPNGFIHCPAGPIQELGYNLPG